MAKFLCAVLFVSSVLIVTEISESQTNNLIIHVNIKVESDCICNSDVSCHNLSAVSELLATCGRNKSVTVIVESDLHLSKVFKVANLSNVNIRGEIRTEGNPPKLSCSDSSDAGFHIDNVHNFKFSNLAVIDCTASLEFDLYVSKHAMIVIASTSVLLNNVQFSQCRHTALVLLNNNDTVIISNASFANNTIGKDITVNLSYPGALNIEQTINSDTRYLISNSSFEHNQTPTKNRHYNPYNKNDTIRFRAQGYGGAVFIVLGGNTTNNLVEITFSNFTNNTAKRGGAIYAYHEGDTRNNTLHFENLKFINNTAEKSGAGMNVGYYNESSRSDNINIVGCTFEGNYACTGAGLAIFSYYGSKDQKHSIVIRNCTWQCNKGVLSPAVDIAPLNELYNGYLPTPVFSNCSFLHNHIHHTSGNQSDTPLQTKHINIGIFSVARFKVRFKGRNNFISNNFSAMVLMSGVVEFERGSNVLYKSNIGYNGGAIAMYAFSTLIFNGPSTVNFSDNYAYDYGGAIIYHTVDQHNFLGNKNCFFDTETPDSPATVSFHNNTAKLGGPAIYSVSYAECYFKCILDHNNTSYNNPESIFQCIAKFQFHEKYPLTSSGKDFNFSKNATSKHEIIPGDTHKIGFEVIDDFNRTVHPLISVTNIETKTTNSVVKVKHPYTLSDEITAVGNESAAGTFIVTVTGVRQIYFVLEITLLPCPPGYHNKDQKCKCAHRDKGYKHIINCDKFNARIEDGVWVGYIPVNGTDNATLLYFAPCSQPLCNMTDLKLPKRGRDLNDHICSKNREGIMCGKCIWNHSSFFNTRYFTCGENTYCHLGILFYFLTEIVPMVIFFVIVITFDLSFTSGNSVGFIFFAQYLDQLTLYVNPIFTHLRTPYRLFYGLFNFEFFNIENLSFCLWEGAQILDIMAFKYLTILIAFCMVLTLIAILRNNMCNRLCHLRTIVSTKTSVVHGLSAFLVICYTQCTKISFHILRVVQPEGYMGKLEHHYSYYGGLHYLQSHHLYYAIPAFIFIILVTILTPLVLFFYPLTLHILAICGLSEHRIVDSILKITFVYKLKPFIDCFQSCYTDKCRFFAGLYFFYRLMILICFTFSSTNFHSYSGLVLIFIMGIHSTVQPFKKRIHNINNSLILFNLSLINGSVILSKLIIDISEDSDITSNKAFITVNVIQLVLLYLPMIAAVCIIGRFCFIRLKKVCPGSAENVQVNDVLNYDDFNRSSMSSTLSYSSSQKLHQNHSLNYGSFMSSSQLLGKK